MYKVIFYDENIHDYVSVKDVFNTYASVCDFCTNLYVTCKNVSFIRAFRKDNPAKRVLLLIRC